jgi:PAS domain-containing protein
MRIDEINPMFARMLKYDRDDLIGKEISLIWTSRAEREWFLSCVKSGGEACQKEVLLRAYDGSPRRCLVSAILSTSHVVLCSAIDITQQRIADEEIRQTLDDLERQVRERTAHLERINEELKAEILERRRIENAILSGEKLDDEKEEDL